MDGIGRGAGDEADAVKIAATPTDYCGPYVLLASRRDAAPISGVVINTDGGIGIRGFLQAAGGEDL